MKCKVRLTRTVELYVEADSEDAVNEWLCQTTPEEAYLATNGTASNDYSEEILCYVDDNSIVDYVIKGND